MKEFWYAIQLIFTVLGGWLGYFLGGCDGLLIALVAFAAIDYITGIMCAISEKRLNSKIGFKGICRKVLIFTLVGVANIIDVQVIGTGSVLRTAVIFFYLSNEGVSLLENAAHLGLPIPKKLKDILEQLHDRIDVSSWQGNIDFAKVKASGIDFVIIRAGYGRETRQNDNCFELNYRNAKAAGLDVGAYWYSYADSAEDAVKEACACMEVIKGKKFEYPIYFDLEEQSQFAKGRNFCDSVIKAFCGELEKNGYLAGLYCSTYYLNNYNELKIKLDNDDLGKAFFSFLKDGINGLRLVDFSDIHFQRQGKIAKFYFIVDRIDLASQAKAEFEARGLKVITVDSKEDFVKNISSIGEADKSGKIAFTVVNIQKFSAESVTKKADYNVNVQRVYFMDEAHRSYNPKGSFLANLMASDREAIMIALTGTPLIGEEYNTKDVFGPYIHKYYYNQSIADGYTLKLIREEIETTYRTQMAATLEQLEVQMGSIKKKDLYSHPKFGDQAYQNNPKFKKFIADNGLGFKPYAQFGKAEITERIQLLVQLVNLVWNTEMFV